MILDASGRELAPTEVAAHDVTHLADAAALSFLLNALVHGADCGVSWSAVLGGHAVQGPFIAVRASRHGVQRRTA